MKGKSLYQKIADDAKSLINKAVTEIENLNILKLMLSLFPYLIIAYVCNKAAQAWHMSDSTSAYKQFDDFLDNFGTAFNNPLPSYNSSDLLFGIVAAAAAKTLMLIHANERKKFRNGEEYGSARWGNSKDIAPYMDNADFYANAILSQTEYLCLKDVKEPKYRRNKNILVEGDSGAGKTRFVVKPNIMQMHSSYVVTDPKGGIAEETGKMLLRGKIVKDKKGRKKRVKYKVKIFNTVDFEQSLHYNPFYYVSKKRCEADILKLVEYLIANTQGTGEKQDFWVKSEKLLYMAFISLIFCIFPEDEQNFETLIMLINSSEVSEDDESYKNAVDRLFDFLELWVRNEPLPEIDEIIGADEDGCGGYVYDEDYNGFRNKKPDKFQKKLGKFAIRQYEAFKLSAGKTAKSILISCAVRLAPFMIDDVLEITSYDELELDKMGDELTALFIIISDTDPTFNFLAAIMYSQLFNLLCTRADKCKGKHLKIPVRFLLDEFANIGKIPNFEHLIATIRSRWISACIFLQTKSQLKAMYKDEADTIVGNCNTTIFLGGSEKTTLKDMAESLGKETIDLFTQSTNKGSQESHGLNYNKTGRELKSSDELELLENDKCIVKIRGVRPFLSKKYDITHHPRYKRLSDYNPKNKLDLGEYVNGIKKAHIRKEDGSEEIVTIFEPTTV